MTQLKENAHIHLMGICGTAMASLAGILKGMGYRITGSDQNVYPPMSTQLANLGITIMEGYKKENLRDRPDLVIVGNVISKTHEEAQALLASDIPYTSLPKALGEFVIDDRACITISGTHGKTTTTSLMAWTAQRQGEKPGFLVGGIPLNFGKSFEVPEGDLFVIEGDEYDTAFFDKVPKFIHYRPRYAILTSVEFDHADIYKDLEDVKAAFRRLLGLIPANGFLVANAEDSNIGDLVREHPKVKVWTYGLEKGDYRVRNLKLTPEYSELDVEFRGQIVEHLKIPMFGKYNMANALAVFAVAHQLGWNAERIRGAFESFRGVKRRQEVLGSPGGVTVIEDFAHHPTAVKLTLEGIRERFAGKKLFAVFEPRSATSRRAIFQHDYVQAFLPADEVVLAEVFNASSLKEGERLEPHQIVNDLVAQKKSAHLIGGVDSIVDFLKTQARAGDVIVIMSNGAFGGIYQKLLSALSAK